MSADFSQGHRLPCAQRLTGEPPWSREDIRNCGLAEGLPQGREDIRNCGLGGLPPGSSRLQTSTHNPCTDECRLSTRPTHQQAQTFHKVTDYLVPKTYGGSPEPEWNEVIMILEEERKKKD